MPTIDELAPAPSASDLDEFIVSQAGIARKITRAQVLGGVQPQITVPPGTLLGNSGTITGAPDAITVGRNLFLSGSTLSAAATPFVIENLPNGTVPSSSDLIPLTQGGTAVAVTYGQLVNGLSGIPNVNISNALVTAAGTTGAQPLGQLVATFVPTTGGTMVGPLALAGAPTTPSHAATKAYVDQQGAKALQLSGGSLTGVLSLAGSPQRPQDAANKAYVDALATTMLPIGGGTLSGQLTLIGDPASALQPATKRYADSKVSRSGDTLTGALSLSGAPVLGSHAATKDYVDAQVGTALPRTGGTLAGSLFLAGDPTSNAQAATKQYVDQRLSRSGDTLTGPLILAADPAIGSEAATKSYVDQQIATSMPRTGGSLSGALSLPADPAAPLQASTKQYVDLRVARSGDTLTGPLYLAGSPQAPLQAATKQYVDGQVATALTASGGTLTGPLLLAGPPVNPMQAATKSYVDANPDARGVINVALPPFGARLDGVSDDTAAFAGAYAAAAAGGTIFVPGGTTVLQQPGSWGVSLTKRVHWVVAGTLLKDGTPLAAAVPTGGGPAGLVLPGFVTGNTSVGATTSQGSSQATDFAVNQSSYIVNHSGGSSGVIANVRADTIIYNSPANYVWNGLDRLVWAGTQTPTGTAVAQHVGRYIQTLRQAATTDSRGSFLPQPQLWGACIEYRDTTGRASSATNAALTVEMDWFGNGADDANTRTIQSLVVGQHNLAGAPVELATVIGVYLAAGSSGSAKTVLAVGVPFSNAVIDTSYAQSINNAPVVKMAAGQAIAFENTNSNRLAYDRTTNTLRWNQGTLSYAVGKGISVGWVNVYSSAATLPSYISGNLIVLNGSGSYSIGLPRANTVAAGTGFTFSVTGTGQINIQPSGGDGIDSGPVTLRPNDRYHIVSDGSGFWREIFWVNAVSPQFSGPVVLASYIVAGLPAGVAAGAKAFASNGRKPGEAAGSGTGVEVFFDGQHWVSSCSGTTVSA